MIQTTSCLMARRYVKTLNKNRNKNHLTKTEAKNNNNRPKTKAAILKSTWTHMNNPLRFISRVDTKNRRGTFPFTLPSFPIAIKHFGRRIPRKHFKRLQRSALGILQSWELVKKEAGVYAFHLGSRRDATGNAGWHKILTVFVLSTRINTVLRC